MRISKLSQTSHIVMDRNTASHVLPYQQLTLWVDLTGNLHTGHWREDFMYVSMHLSQMQRWPQFSILILLGISLHSTQLGVDSEKQKFRFISGKKSVEKTSDLLLSAVPSFSLSTSDLNRFLPLDLPIIMVKVSYQNLEWNLN